MAKKPKAAAKGIGSTFDPAVAAGEVPAESIEVPLQPTTTTPLEQAMAAFDLEPRHILAHRVLDDGSVRILTQGGQRIVWPRDVGRTLSPMEKGDGEPAPPPGGVMSR